MATTKPRINITIGPEIKTALKIAAARDRVPLATKAAELIAIGLDLEEDIALAEMAEQRRKTDGKLIPHQRVWP